METEEAIKRSSSPALQEMDPTVEVARKLISGEYTLAEKCGRSDLWLIYKTIVNGNKEEIPNYLFCTDCKRVLRNFTVYNLRTHKCFSSKYSNIEKENSMNEDENTNETTGSSETIDYQLSKLLRKWIIKECQSHDLMESDGLKSIFQEIGRLGSQLDGEIDANRLLPNFSEIAEKLSEIYEQCFETVTTEIASIKDDGFSLTVDITFDNISEQNYIAVSMHYLKNGTLIFRLLGLQSLKSNQHLGQNIIEKIKHLLSNFECKLSSKTFLVTNKYDNSQIKNNTDVHSLSCMSTLLGNALNKSVEGVPEVMKIICAGSDLVNFLTKTRKESVLGDFPYNCFNNCWLATFNMLNSIETNWNNIEIILQKMNEEGKLAKLNKQHLKAVTEVVQPFSEAIETLEDSNSATLHLVYVLLHELKKSFVKTDIEVKHFKFIEQLKENIRHHLEKIAAEDISILHKIALFLYPPTNQLLPFNADEKKCIENECIRLMQNYKQVSKPITKPETPVPKRKKLFADFLACEIDDDPNKLFNQELQCYKNTYVSNSEDFDVLSWWEQHKEKFPFLYKLSCIVLSTPATCAASRRIFSASSRLFNGKSTQCSKETEIEKIMFINSNAELNYLDIC